LVLILTRIEILPNSLLLHISLSSNGLYQYSKNRLLQGAFLFGGGAPQTWVIKGGSDGGTNSRQKIGERAFPLQPTTQRTTNITTVIIRWRLGAEIFGDVNKICERIIKNFNNP